MLFHLPKRLLLALLLSMYTSGVDSGAHEVFNAVFKNYNKYLRPVKYSKTVTLVHVDSGLYSIDQVSELTETLTITTWLWMVWQDEFLTWDPTKYNESQITVPSTLFWIPDIQIYSLQETVAPVSRADTFGTLTSDGVVELALLQVVKVHCNFDIKLFPFDTQNCSIKYGSWEYDIEHIDMAVKTDGFGLSEYQNNTEWELLSYTADRYVTNEEDGQYIEINFHLIIKRRPMYYIFALVVPSFVISMLAIVGLFSPFNAKGERQEKVTMGLTTLLTMAVLLLIVAEQMPKTSEGLPLIGMYILCEIIVSSIATTVTVIIMYLHRRVLSGRPIPRWLLKILCLPSNKISMSTQWTYDRVSCCCLSKNSSTNSSRKGIVNASYHSKISVENISNQVEVCLANLKEVSRFLYEKNNEQELENAWRKVTDRIDIVMLIIFLITNLLISIIMLVIIGLLHTSKYSTS